MTPDPYPLWARSSHAQIGKGFDRARTEMMALRGVLDEDEPIENAFLSGMGFLLGLVYAEVAFQMGATKKRDFAPLTEQALNTLTDLKEAAMPVVESQVDAKLAELNITPPKRRAVRKSKEMGDLWPWYLSYRAKNPNARITGEPNEDGFFRVYARQA